VFIECTATDLTKAKVVLNTVCAMFSEYCSAPYVVEPVEVIDSFGESHGEQQCSTWACRDDHSFDRAFVFAGW
jgi:phenylalanyl-tRNA synthetase beta chain